MSCQKCGDSGYIMKMLDPDEYYVDGIESVDIEEDAWLEPCDCEAGKRMVELESQQLAEFEACLLPGVTLCDLPEPPFAPMCEYFDMNKYLAYHEKWCREDD